MWKVKYFETRRGDMPVLDYLKDVEYKTMDKIQRAVDTLVVYGPKTPYPFSKRISKNISELRSSGKNPIRILYGRIDDTFILLNIFIKKTNKLPKKEYDLAEKRFKQY